MKQIITGVVKWIKYVIIKDRLPADDLKTWIHDMQDYVGAIERELSIINYYKVAKRSIVYNSTAKQNTFIKTIQDTYFLGLTTK